ncbi:MAG: hypothetical protein RLZZ399_515 [Verrucomicrobiota bacterium]
MNTLPDDLAEGPTQFSSAHGKRVSRIAFGLCGLFTAISFFGATRDIRQFSHSWLFAFAFAFTISVGALFWTILHNSTDSEWGVLVRRQMENLSSGLWVLPIAFIPLVLFCAPSLWKWWQTPSGVDVLLDLKSAFLNKSFFCVRSALYFLSLGYLAFALRRHSVLQDASGSSFHTYRVRRLSISGLPILAVCLTFAAVDWLMALDHHWFSTMWGVYVFAGSAGSSMALLVILVAWLRRSGYLLQINVEHFHVMGKFLLAFTVFWAYVGFSQYMLIWYANIPEETIYFKVRNTGGWHVLSTLLVIGRFFIPFPILLFQSSKKKAPILLPVCAWIILMQLLDVYLIVMPALKPDGFSPSFLDATCLIAVCTLCVGVFFRSLRRSALFPLRDPRLGGSVSLHN